MNGSRRGRLTALLFPGAIACLLIAGSATALAGSGVATLESPGPDASTAPSASQDPQQAFLDFAQCMRDHGIDMPDPVFGEGPGGEGTVSISIGGPGSSGDPGPVNGGPGDPAFQAANEACSHFLTSSGPTIDPAQQQEMQDQMLAFAQCMRDHGIDMPDPQFSSDGGFTMIGGPGPGSDIDPTSPEFQAANEACGSALGLPTGPGTGGVGVQP